MSNPTTGPANGRPHWLTKQAALRLGGLALSLSLLASCAIERIAPDAVGAAVARLSMRNVAILLSAINDNDHCGLGSEQALRNAVVDGEVGRVGTYTVHIENCEVDFPEVQGVTESCRGEVNAAIGKAVVTATQTVEGIITGDPSNPVVPLRPDAAKISISARFDGFEVLSSGASNSLRIDEGSLDVDLYPRLAVADSNGICSKIGSNVTIERLRYGVGSKLHITNGLQQFDVPVDTSDIWGQLGRYKDRENYLTGRVRVWDVDVNVPEAHEDNLLDPDYDRETFLASYSCMDDLRLPVTYTCDDLSPAFAQGSAQLAIRDFGGVMAAIEADTRCGFSNPVVLENAILEGELGRPGGRATYVLDTPCELNFTTPYLVSENCHEVGMTIQGVARVKGTKTLEGIRTGNIETPMVPTTSNPARFDLEVEFLNFVTKSTASEQSLLIRSGSMTGVGIPTTAMDLSLGACSIVTPNIEFQDLSLKDADVLLRNDGMTISLAIADSDLNAVNGIKGDRVNFLEGSIVVDGETLLLPEPGAEPILDPAYDARSFVESYTCDENLYVPETPEECDFTQALGEGAARLIVQSVGTVAGLVNGDDDCGFADLLGQIQPSEVVGEPGEMGLMRWDIADCHLGREDLGVFSQDCLGGRTFLEGFANIDASRIVRGEREKILVAVDSIKPTDPSSVDVILDGVELEEFSTYSIAANKSAPAGELLIHAGVLDAVVHPGLGEMASDPGRFMIPTPVAAMEEIRLSNASTTLQTQGMTFRLDISDARLFATNGSINGAANQLEGYVVINGVRVDIPSIALNPDYDPETFDASYACTEDLAAVLGAND